MNTKQCCSGDVHLAAVGQFYSNPNLNITKDRDYRYMPNIISSAIADVPTTEMISDTLNRRNQVHHMDSNTDEEMIPIFTHDVNNKVRKNKRLLPRRNWCSIRLYEPGTCKFWTIIIVHELTNRNQALHHPQLQNPSLQLLPMSHVRICSNERCH